MNGTYDVAGRLAEGQPAVEHTRTYVQACQAVGYEQPDLTARPSQVQEWYDSEAGLDLRVLDRDAAELRVAVTAVEEALWVQRSQVTELASAWRGVGADSSTGFLRRHCDVAAEVAGHVRAAAEQCAALRDELWRVVDGKVATTIAIDERRVAERPAWLAAAHSVASGSAERSAAEAVIHRQVLPYVDNDIRNDWLAAMSSASASVAAAYDSAIHGLASAPDVRFDIPGDLGPSWQAAIEERPAATSAVLPPALPAPTMPAAAPVAAQPTPDVAQAVPPAQSDGTAPEAATPLSDAAGLPSGAGGLGGLGGMTGLGGIVGSIVDSIGNLLGSLAGGSDGGTIGDDPLGLDDTDEDPTGDDPGRPHDADDAKPVGVDDAVVPDPPATENLPAPAETVGEPAAPPPDVPPPDAPPPTDQPPPAAPPAEGSTPCEIAEDQLPQAGQ